jgi:hypothetical protein
MFSIAAVVVLGSCVVADVLAADAPKTNVRNLAPASSAARQTTTTPAASAVQKAQSALAPTPPPVVPAPSPTHGLWVWRTQQHLDAGDASRLLATCVTSRVTEVYLAVDSKVLGDARLQVLVAKLRSGNVRVVALMGDAVWYKPEKRSSMFAMIDGVGSYNGRAPANAQFQGVQFDIEPHQLPENKGVRTYLPALAETLSAGRQRAAGFGLEASACLPRFVIDDAPQLHHAFATAVPRIFLMLYELSDKGTSTLVRIAGDTATSQYKGEPTGNMVVGVSVDDYADVQANLRAIEAAKPGGAYYGGWAIHDEARYKVRLDANGH